MEISIVLLFWDTITTLGFVFASHQSRYCDLWSVIFYNSQNNSCVLERGIHSVERHTGHLHEKVIYLLFNHNVFGVSHNLP
jgi:hypothetical protein